MSKIARKIFKGKDKKKRPDDDRSLQRVHSSSRIPSGSSIESDSRDRSYSEGQKHDLTDRQVSVTVGRLTGLAESSGLVYCVIRLEAQVVQTTCLDLAEEKNLQWVSETFTFDMTTRNAVCQVEVWQKPGHSAQGKLLGSVAVEMRKVEHVDEKNRPIFGEDKKPGGVIRLSIISAPSRQSKPTYDSFEILKVIGKGTFGKVVVCRKKDTKRLYAMKIIKKSRVYDLNAVEHTLTERKVLKTVSHAFLVNLKFSFQTKDRLYFVMDYVNGGELFYHMTHTDEFSVERARFYVAELALAIGFLHENRIIYRDLKPENLLLDITGHICITDFGLSKENLQVGDKTFTYCGSPEYLAPEMILGVGYGQGIDWWALGTLLYEMLAGWPPFYDENYEVMNSRIVNERLEFPRSFDESTRDLLEKLLEKNPKKRLSDVGQFKKHPFFKGIDWGALAARSVTPPFVPHLRHELDTKYIDEEFTADAVALSPAESSLTSTQQDAFQNFSYVDPAVEEEMNRFRRRRHEATPPFSSNSSGNLSATPTSGTTPSSTSRRLGIVSESPSEPEDDQIVGSFFPGSSLTSGGTDSREGL